MLYKIETSYSIGTLDEIFLGGKGVMKKGFILPDNCPRGRTNCDPYDQIVSSDGSSFFCCGLHDGSLSKVLQDKYTVCFKGERDDRISMCDKRDLIHHASVLIRSLAIIEEIETDDKSI